MSAAYLPDRGDVVWISLNPQAGHEQAGRRPAIVLSPAAYNGRVGLLICCPLTNQVKGYPFEVLVPPGQAVTGAILADQVKSLDWRAQRRVHLRVARRHGRGSAGEAEYARRLTGRSTRPGGREFRPPVPGDPPNPGGDAPNRRGDSVQYASDPARAERTCEAGMVA